MRIQKESTRGLDKLDRPTSVDGPAVGPITTSYRSDGQLLSRAEPNGNTTAYAYDALGRELSRTTTAAGPVTRAALARTYNRAGQVLTENSTITGDPTNGLTTYTYDPLERLTGVTTPAATTTTYGWDKVPNRTSVTTGGGAAVTTTYDAANRPQDQAGVANAYTSDADGRLTTQPSATGAGFQRYEWDSLGRLTTVKPPSGGSTIATYTYDPLDRLRLADYGANTRTRFRYVGLTTAVAQLIDDKTGAVSRNIGTGWGGERQLDWTGTNATIRYYGTNAHHDTVWTASSTGAVSATLRYDPWGTLTTSSGSSLPDFRFQGSWFDDTTKLSWVITRWYAPALGRFLSEDSLLGTPADPPSRHLYAYAAGEPIGRWDPDGRRPLPAPTWWRRGFQATGTTIHFANPKRARGRLEIGLFIQQPWNDANIGPLNVMKFEGDSRGFSAGSLNCFRARGCIKIDFDRSRVEFRLNPTCGKDVFLIFTGDLRCHDQFPFVKHLPRNLRELDDDGNKRNFVSVQTNGRGVVTVEWDLTQSLAPVFRPNLTINGRIIVDPPKGDFPGTWRYKGDYFPSQEIYYFLKGKRTTILRAHERFGADGMAAAAPWRQGTVLPWIGDAPTISNYA